MSGWLLNIAMGWALGFLFGVGCALAVMYSIYAGGYRKATEDSLRVGKSQRYLRLVPKALAAIAREQGASTHSSCL